MARVLVTDGDQRSSLAVVRSLGQSGHEVIVSGPQKRCLASISRFARSEVVTASPLRSPEAFVESIRTLLGAHDIELIVPMTEAALLCLSMNRDRLDGVALPVPRYEVIRRILDKGKVRDEADAVGFSVPEQAILDSPGNGLPPNLVFPLVIKPTRSVVGPPGRQERVAVSYAQNFAELDAALERMPRDAWPLLLQERVVGPGLGLFFLIWDGKLLARFAHRRIREKPPSGGVSVLREAVAVQEDWFERGAELLRRMGWYGAAMVELKEDLHTGRPFVMEVNPRFWGSLQLAIDAGVDFPSLFVSAWLEEEVKPVISYRVGTKTRWFLGDLDHLLLSLLRSRQTLNLQAEAPRRVETLYSFISSFRPSVRNEVFRVTDPLPGLLEAWQWFKRL